MKSSSAVIPTMKFILTDMFRQWTMDYYYKPRLKHGSQRSMWRMFNFKVMFQAFELYSFLYFIWVLNLLSSPFASLEILLVAQCVVFVVFME